MRKFSEKYLKYSACVALLIIVLVYFEINYTQTYEYFNYIGTTKREKKLLTEKKFEIYHNYSKLIKSFGSHRKFGVLSDNLFKSQGFTIQTQFNITTLPLFPFELINPHSDDRILAQMMYIPHQLIEARKSGHVKRKRIHHYGSIPNQDLNLSLCPVHECDITYGFQNWQTADLLIIESSNHPNTIDRLPNQAWLAFLLESPFHLQFVSENIGDQINYTATYRLDSTIVAPYYKYVRFTNESLKLNQNDSDVVNYAKNKTKLVAWFVSNCGSLSPRLEYAKQLNKYIKVDIYGACGTLVCHRSDDACFQSLKQDYKFYLSFENSICQDYITEKFFLNGLNNHVIPVVMGASKMEYEQSSPQYSFIHVDDFQSPKTLADYLLYLNDNDTAYNEYFAWINKGTQKFNTYTECRFCMLAHEMENLPAKWYPDFNLWWKKGCESRKQPKLE